MTTYGGARVLRRLAGVAYLAATAAQIAPAQIKIQGEDASVRIGIEGQFWADWCQDATPASQGGSQGYQQNLYLRRIRIMLAGDIGDSLSFFVETDSPNLGKTPKSPASGFLLQDAILEWKESNALRIGSGLITAPLSRNSLQSTTSYYTLDLSPLAAINNTATQSVTLRDLGVQARGFFLKDKLQYRLGAFQGERDANAHNSLRTAGYLQFDFFEPETGIIFTGTALGKKKILAIDGGFDAQGSYRGESANVAIDYPVRKGDEIGGQFQYFHYDGGQKFATIADQNDWFAESAFYLGRRHAQPFAKFEEQNFTAGANASKDIHRAGGGLNYYVRGQNLKWTVQYTRALPQNGSLLRASNEFTMQVQFYYF